MKTVQSYDKQKMQLKNKNYDNYREYTTVIAQFEIEKDIFLKSGSPKTLLENENAMYNALILSTNIHKDSQEGYEHKN